MTSEPTEPAAAGPEGLLIVDKPGGLTSHDVVARIRRLLGVRRVGHAGTLDPMATGVLVLGVGRATRLLGHLALGDKDYLAGIRLGVSTTTDDAEGEVTGTSDRSFTRGDLAAAMVALTGTIEQVPPAFSAIKVQGRRAYVKARAGEKVHLAARRVTVRRFDLTEVRGSELTVEVTCSSGTYIRALARDLGNALGTGGHLCSLRRTRVGAFGVADARTLGDLASVAAAGEPSIPLISLSVAVANAFPRRDLSPAEVVDIGYGRALPATGAPGVHGVFGSGDLVLALVEDRNDQARPLVVFEARGAAIG